MALDKFLGTATVSGTNNSTYVSAEFERIAEILSDIDPTLHLALTPPENANTLEEKMNPYVIVVMPEGREPYIYRTLSKADLNHNLIATILMDKRTTQSLTDVITAQDLAREMLKAKEEEDKRAEMLDRLYHGLHRR